MFTLQINCKDSWQLTKMSLLCEIMHQGEGSHAYHPNIPAALDWFYNQLIDWLYIEHRNDNIHADEIKDYLQMVQFLRARADEIEKLFSK